MQLFEKAPMIDFQEQVTWINIHQLQIFALKYLSMGIIETVNVEST